MDSTVGALLGTALGPVEGCLDVGACDRDGDADGEMVVVGASLGDLVPLGAALLFVDGRELDVGAYDLDGEADGEIVAVGALLGDLVPLGAEL